MIEDDECYRCGYDLRGLGDEQACPECGLLASRSRRGTDELHDTRPGWLRGLSIGTYFILLGIVAPFVWPFFESVYPDLFLLLGNHSIFVGLDCLFLFLPMGIFLLTRREGYKPADAADRRLRLWLRLMAIIPLIAGVILHLWKQYFGFNEVFVAGELFALMLLPLPLLLFLRLRGLAVRVHSAHLAEHCMIVGIGASSSMLYIIVTIAILNYPATFGLEEQWSNKSNVSMMLVLLLSVAACLFVLWSLYVLVRFAIAFGIARRKLKLKWLRDDRSKTAQGDLHVA